MNVWFVREAIASVALSHEDWCSCITCRAARGNVKAFTTILADLSDIDTIPVPKDAPPHGQ